MKQTAVDWLVYQLNLEPDGWMKDLIEQAKEMEKEQIIDAMNRMGNTDFYCEYEDPEQYYNETYKTEKE
jgi:hypothetical protein